jgi:PmbA protein
MTKQFQQLSQDILKEAARLGASEAEVAIATNKGFSVRAREGDVETVEYNQDKVIDIKVYFGKRSGSASLSDIRIESVHAAVEAACHIAKFTDEDPASGLADKADLAMGVKPLDLEYPWSITVEQAIEMACQCEKIALAYDKRIMSAEEASVSTVSNCYLYANSLGFIGIQPETRHDISCVLISKQGDEMQRDYDYTVAVDPAMLESTDMVAKQAAEKTVRRLGARRLPTMKVPVIFAAEEARGLWGHLAAAISGGNVYRKSTFLLDHIGKSIFPTFVRIEEQPFLSKAIGSASFDNDGVATRNNVFVEEGVLRMYALGSYSARKLGLKTTGNAGGMHNLTIKSGNKNLEQIIKTMHKGLLVTELMGNGVNIVTGDYSRGVGGYWIENGEIQYPVHEITVASKLKDMYAGIVEIGNDVDTRGNIRTGSVLINEMMVAGE